MPNTERLEQDEQLEQPVKQTKRAYLLNTVVKLMIVVVAFITFYAIYLDGKIRAKMDGKTWELPAEVYARIESISIDDNLTLEQVKTALLDNGYRQVSQIATPGDFKIEDDTDQLQIALRRTLFGLETELNPIDVMFLYKCIERISILADQAQRIGSRIELMLAKA